MSGKDLEISKARLKKVGSREKRSAAGRNPVPFRNSALLAMLYVIATMLCAVGMMAWTYPLMGFRHWYKRLPLGIVLVVFAVICARVMLRLVARDVLKRNSRLLMLCIIALFSMLFHSVCLTVMSLPEVKSLFPFETSQVSHFLFPYLFAPALATLLAGPAAGVSFGIGMVFINLLFVTSEAAMLPAFTAGTAAAVVVPRLVAKVRRRLALLRSCAAAFAIQLLGIVVFLGVILVPGVMRDYGESFATLGGIAVFAIVATVSSIMLAYVATLLLLPILEHLFAATSNIRLNEFTDLGNPLLQRLSLEAPGTYHHCIVVATLAAAAADRIAANSLLARVGAYFHDIGKLTKPSFYSENIGADRLNPHEGLSPNMSAVIIAAHVKEGIGMSIHYNLPPPIYDIIREHHGTSVMSWFLHKAKEEAKEKTKNGDDKSSQPLVDESQFRYPGPRPTTKEAAIVMLADSVEAASRSLDRPTRTNIENMVENIVNGKIKDEQLNSSPLTFLDVVSIKRSFANSLTNILHARVAYPKEEGQKDRMEEKQKEPASETYGVNTEAKA